jgi:uncharacterized peroxidase-related enzyme
MRKPFDNPAVAVAWLRVPGIDEVPPRVRSVFRQSAERLGFVDNLLRVFALAPDRISPFYDYVTGLEAEGGALSSRERAVLGVVVAAENRSAFGLVASSAMLRREAASPELVEILATNPQLAPLSPRERAVVELGTKITREAGALDQTDLQRLRDLGFSDTGIFEVVELVAALNAIHRVSNALGVAPNRHATGDHAGRDFPIG